MPQTSVFLWLLLNNQASYDAESRQGKVVTGRKLVFRFSLQLFLVHIWSKTLQSFCEMHFFVICSKSGHLQNVQVCC